MNYSDKRKYGICHLCGTRLPRSMRHAYCKSCAKKRTELAQRQRRTRLRTCPLCFKEFTGLKRRICDQCADPFGAQYKKRQKEWRQKLKRRVFDAYGGAVCSCCGEREFLFLSMDHIQNNGAEHRRALNPKYGTGGARFYGWLRRNKFPAGYQVLCMNCQWGKKLNGGICPHKEN